MASGAASRSASNVGGPLGIGALCGRSVGAKRAPETSIFPETRCSDTRHRFEFHLAQPHRVRRHLDTLVLAHELQRLVERQLARRHQPHQDVRGGGAHVGQVLLLHRVDVKVLLAGVFAHDHALVDLFAGLDEHRPALLQVEQRERRRLAAAVGHEAARRAQAHVARPRLPLLEDVVQQAGAAGVGEELGAEADQAAGGDEVVHPDPARAVVDHLLHPALAEREHLRDHADVLLGHVDRHPLDRLVADAVDLADDDLRLADGQLEALAAHDLDEDRELQLATALDLPGVRALGRQHADRDVADRLRRQAVLDLAGGQLVAVLAGQRREVDADGDADRGLVDVDQRQRARVLEVGERLADRDVGACRRRR